MNVNRSGPAELFVQVHVTSACNLRCRHCYIDAEPAHMPLPLFERVLHGFRKLVDHLSPRQSWVQLTGGEPLTHPRFARLLRTSSLSFPTRVLTNGTLIDTDTAGLLASECQSVQVSFDGLRDGHDSWRGSGSYDAALAGLMNLKQADAVTLARMTVASENCAHVFDLFDELSPHIDGFAASRVVPIAGCGLHQPDRDTYRRIIYGLYGRSFTDCRIRVKDPFFGPLMRTDGVTGFCGCSAGICGMCVTEQGDIYPCRRLPVRLGNIEDITLLDAYMHPLCVSLRGRMLNGRCGDCENRMVCGGSRCIAYALTGDPLGEDPDCIFL